MSERIDTDIINQATDWGTAISEVTGRKTPIRKLFLIAAFVLLAAGAILIIPVMAGTLLFNSSGAVFEVAVVGGILLLALAFKNKSDQPRNALQIDYKAGELRLGTEHADGTFQRHQVVGFRNIESVFIDTETGRDPALCVQLPGELVTLNFHGADDASLHELVTKISAARESALRAPVRSRIQSRMRGFEASFHEAKQRIRSRITRPVM